MIKADTFLRERDFENQRFFKDDRVRLRHFPTKRGTVIRSAVKDEGGVIVEWDDRPRILTVHNPRYLENVWLDPETGEEEK